MSSEPGFCECGCGGRTTISPQTRTAKGVVKGEPQRFLPGHASRGQTLSPEHRAAIGAALTGKPRSAETRRKISETLTGRPRSAETRRKLSETRRGPGHNMWKGGRVVTTYGYVDVWVGPEHPMADAHGYCREHRLVMAEHLGRMLAPEEVVHHLTESEGGTGDKADNRIEHLRLFPSSVAHGLHHRALGQP